MGAGYHREGMRVKNSFVISLLTLTPIRSKGKTAASLFGEYTFQPTTKLQLAFLCDEAGDCVHQIELGQHFKFAGFHFHKDSRAFVAQQVSDALDGCV